VNCQKGIYYNRTMSAPDSGLSCGDGVFEGGNNYCIYSAIAGANRNTCFYENHMSAGGGSYPIWIASHNNANLTQNEFLACPAASHKAWYNPAAGLNHVQEVLYNSYYNGCVAGAKN
jgi:hypothetical protein